MWYVCDVLYVHVSCFVVHGCAVSRRYMDVCNCDVFNVVNMYLDHLKFCVVYINGRRYVCCSEWNVSYEPTPCLVRPVGAHVRGENGFLNYDNIWICVVNKQFELLEFDFDSVYVGLQYDEISLIFTAGSV